MTPSFDGPGGDRLLRDAITALEPPSLAEETFARVAARRARGERISLLTVDAPGRPLPRGPVRTAAILFGAAAAVVVALVVNRQRSGAPEGAVSSESMALSPVDAACASYAPQDSSTLRHLMVSAFGVAAACGAELEPSVPLTVIPSQITPGKYTYGDRTVTDGLHTSDNPPTTISISRMTWHGKPALIALRDGPLIYRVSIDSLTVSARDLTPLHWASWYITQKPVGSMHAEFAADSVTIVMSGRVDTSGTFAYSQVSGRLPQEWVRYLTIPSLPLTNGWHGVLEIAAPIHPHTHAFFTKGWATMSLHVVGRERVTVAAGSFDCWKVQLGTADFESYMWVSTSNHLVVRSRTNHQFADTQFEDQVDLLKAIPSR